MIFCDFVNKGICRIVSSHLLCVSAAIVMLVSLTGCAGKSEDNSPSVPEVSEEIPVYGTEPVVDLIFFMGQSNMSGRGDASMAPEVAQESGVEFRAYSDPTRFYPITEPFGMAENNPEGLCEDDIKDKSGSLVSSFINEYHNLTGNKVIAVSVSKGGLAMDLWLNDGIYSDVKARINTAKSYLEGQGIVPGHTYVVWLQGESDSSREVPAKEYLSYFQEYFDRVFLNGIDEVFIILPGMSSWAGGYTGIVDAQKEICSDDPRFCLATTVIRGLSDENFADIYHLNQHALNLTGMESAKAAAYYTQNGRKPVIFDYEIGEYYVPSGSEDIIGECIERISLENVNEEF